jgi:DNA-directed RNA polymerase beta subunit
MNLTPILQSPDEKRERIRNKVVEGLTESFPITARNKIIEVTDVSFTPRDYTSNEQKMAILRGDSLFETAKGTVKIKDAKTGKVLDEAKGFTLARVPWFTPRHTLIVGGNEYSIANMVRPKPGVYARKRANGILEASFNTIGTSNFNVTMDPEKGEPELEYESSKIPLYTILRASGMSHETIAKKWGTALANENRKKLEKNLPQHVDRLYKKVVPAYALLPDLTVDAKMAEIVKRYGTAKMDPKVNEKTLGHAYGHVTPDSLLDASAKVLSIFRNPEEVDDRDNLDFKSLRSVEDFFKERIQLDARDIGRRAAIKIENTPEVRKAMAPGAFTPGLVKFITGSQLAAVPTQTNPMELIDAAVRVTALGEGGISSERAIPMEARMIHPTQIGAIDPVRTPESFRAGIDVRAAIGAHHDKDGNIYVPMFDLATGKQKHIRAGEIATSIVAFPQQVLKGKVSALVNGRVAMVPASKVQYQIPHSSAMYGPTSNLIPFIESLQGNRQLMGSKHQTQAISLVDREAPYVQVMAPGGKSFEHLMATIVNPTAPVAGTIEKVDGDYIYIRPHDKTAAVKKDKDSDLVRVSYDTYLPMAAKTYLNHTVTVKAGDEVKKDEILAESNFTKDKTLALGKNLSVAYMPYYGANSNDAVVISSGAAKKLTSERLYKIVLPRDADMVFNSTKHKTYYGHTYGHDYYKGVDEEGVVRPGAKINSGEPVVFGLRKSTLTSDDILLGRLHKSLVRPFRDATQTWDHDHPGEVMDVVKTPKRIAITIKTQEPMQIGDKLCYTEDTEVLTTTGWKYIVDVTTDDICYTLDTQGIIHLYNPTHTNYYSKAGQLFLVRSQHADLSVTLDHSQVIKDGDRNKLVPSRELVNKPFQLVRTGIWTPKSAPESDSWCALVGLYAVKGHLIPATLIQGVMDHSVEIYLRPRMLEEERPWLDLILQDTHLKDKSYIQGDILIIRDRDFYLSCQVLGDVVERRLPTLVFTLAPSQAGIIIDSVLKAAGHQTGRSHIQYGDGTDVCVVYSRQLADDLQRLALHAGYSANIATHTVKRPQYAKRYSLRFLRKRSNPFINNPRGNQQNTRVIDSDAPVFGITIPNHTLYVRVNGKPVWSGNSGRYGNKGVVSEIVPDDQMIKDEAGRPIDVLLTSAGVVSRVNPAQIIETAVGKVVEKTGKPLIVESFSGRDNVKWAKDLLQEHGLKDKEMVFDPRSGKSIPNVMVGRQYIFKMFKSTDTNYSARGVDTYDANLQPTKGGSESAKAIGKMEFDALVAHNARNVLRESSVLKSQKNDEYWRALQLGYPTPPPRTSFASDKFFNMLTGAGVRVDRKGSKIGLAPLTDADVMEMSAGEIQDAKLVSAKNLMPEKGGLFDPAITGGMKGTKWSHINLAEPIINPIFNDPVRRLLGMTNAQLDNTVRTKGIGYVKSELAKIDVTKRESELMDMANNKKGNVLDDVTKQIKYLRALKAQNISPEKAYISSVIPVLPPIFRPVLPGKGGQELIYGDINPLYRDLVYVNNQFKELKKSGKLPDEEAKLRGTLQSAVGAVYGMNDPITQKSKSRNHKGFLTYIAGQGSPKYGYVHSKLLKKQQDLAGRGTIVPDTTLGMDEVGLPENMIWTMYKPFMITRLVGQGYPALQAKQMVDDKHPAAREAMMRETRERPVMINRAPTLHRYGIVGAYAIPNAGKTIRINPFAEVGTNSDFDGDTMMVHVPAGANAVEDVKRMTLSNTLYTDKIRGDLLVAPRMESVMGLAQATAVTGSGKAKVYQTKAEAMADYNSGKIDLGTRVTIKDRKP